jgi:hypothetical protein
MAPALTCGMPHNIRDPQGFEALTQALARGNHRRHVEQPEIPGDEDTVADGSAIPGHLFGGKALSREVAGCILR